MLNRIFKTILVLSICVGISLPTNAAVSVSDGSAFVTKAEFAADLNNLSNRMAQLENSLDAKIDSLVSSYLTRNGIWNGARQDFVQNYYWLAVKSGASTTKQYTFTNGVRGYVGKTMNVTISKNYVPKTPSSYAAGTYYRQDWVTGINIIDYYNKTGLLVLNTLNGNPYTWSNISGLDNRNFGLFLQSGSRFLAQSGIYFEYLNNGNLVATSAFCVGGSDTMSNESCSYGLAYSINSYYFFVSKGESLTANIYWDYIGFGANAAFKTNTAFSYNVTGEWGPCVIFLDAYIY